MKKFIVLLCFTVFMSTILSTNVLADKIESEETPVFHEYVHGELTISSDVTLTEEQLDFIISIANSNEMDTDILDPNKEIEFKPFSIDSGSTGIIIEGPYYKTYTNTTMRALITIAADWVHSKIKKLPSGVGKVLTGGVFVATEKVAPTYVGLWTWKSYDQFQKRYRYYVTLVHYKHSNYTVPIKSQIVELPHNYQ